MSRRWDDHVQTDDLATPFQRDGQRGTGHDRIHGDNPIGGESSAIAMSGDIDNVGIDITAGQKMLSAMSGSLLTSLLGRRYP
jgi:solute carrier family 25 protein 39/40